MARNSAKNKGMGEQIQYIANVGLKKCERAGKGRGIGGNVMTDGHRIVKED